MRKESSPGASFTEAQVLTVWVVCQANNPHCEYLLRWRSHEDLLSSLVSTSKQFFVNVLMKNFTSCTPSARLVVVLGSLSSQCSVAHHFSVTLHQSGFRSSSVPTSVVASSSSWVCHLLWPLDSETARGRVVF